LARLVPLLALIGFTTVFAQTKTTPFDAAWFQHSRWNDNKAEVFQYRTLEKKYDALRSGTATWIVVKENHVPDYYVKSENNAPSSVPMLKFVQIYDTPTGIYTYHQEIISFVRQDTQTVPRSTFSSQEWCGLTFKDLILLPTKAVLEFNSYWEKEGLGSLTFETKTPVIPYNALPLLIRALAVGKKEFRIQLFDDLISNKVGKPAIQEATLSLRPNGKKKNLLDIEVKHPKGVDHFSIDTDKDKFNQVVSWKKWDGSSYELVEMKRIDYWNRHGVEDEALRFKSFPADTKN